MRRSRASRRPPIPLIAGILATAAAAIAVVARAGRRARRRRSQDAAAIWTCACGTALRSTGSGRHQVHWLATAPASEPLLDDACPSCGRTLTGAAPAGP